MLAAIAFVPATDVVACFDVLVDTDHPEAAECIVTYFEDNFIGRPDRRGNRRQPVFPHDLWNVHDRVSEALPRTNNSVEAWHHSFQRSLQCWHPTLWKFIDALKKEERLQRLNINQLLLGQVVVPKRRMTDERVSNIVRDYANRSFTEFLRAIAHNLRF